MFEHAKSNPFVFLLLCSLICCLACDSPSATTPARSSLLSNEDLQDPSKIISAFEKTLQGLPSLRCKLQAVIHIEAKGMDNRMVSDYSVQIEQPRRWAIVKESGMMGGTSVSDGHQVTNYIPMMQQYSVEDLPEDWLESMPAIGPAQSMGMMGPAAFASFFLGHGLADWMLDGVNKSEHLGRESLDDVECEHYRYTQEDGSAWELWVEVGEHVLFRRFEMKPDVSQAGGPMQGMSMTVQVSFDDWDLKAKFTEDDFVFEPPSGAKKVQELFAGSAAEPEPHALIGEEAPSFEVQKLDGDPFKLEDHLGQKVIVLDFWATWCGPCTAALPGLAKVAKNFEGKEVLVYAVNQREEAEVIQEFLSKEELELAVLLDSQGSVGDLYAVEGIPMTAVIGKDKRVHVVHVGFSRGMEKKLTQEIKKLLAGEDIATSTISKAEEQEQNQASEIDEKGTVELWTLKGRYAAVAVDSKTKEIYALLGNGKISQISAEGKQMKQIDLEESGTLLRLANLAGSDEVEFVTMDAWGKGVYACDHEGALLWSYPRGDGVDDVACKDLNGDGLDEVIIGYNGGTGLHVLDNRGKLLWKTTSIGNVWHVDAGNFLADGGVQVVSTSAQGKLHVFTDSGEAAAAHKVAVYANMVRLITLGNQPSALALIGGSSDGGESLLLVDAKGRQRWELELPILDTAHIDTMVTNSRSAEAAVAMRGGLVHVIDAKAGQISATVGRQGTSPSVALLAVENQPTMLLVATGTKLNAFAVTPSMSEESKASRQADSQ